MKLSQKADSKFDQKKRYLPYVKGRNKVNSIQKQTKDMIRETEPKRIIKIYSSLDNKHTIFLAPSLLLARVIVLFRSRFSAVGQQIMQTACQGALTTHQAMPHVGAQSAELAEVHTKIFRIHLNYG